MTAKRLADIIQNADLSGLSTFRLAARAAELWSLESTAQLDTLECFSGPTLILGGGSNTLFLEDYPGRVVVNRLRGVKVRENGDDMFVSAAAGENWHGLVKWCLNRGLHGIENLAMIPGSVGAAPMQNIGAYGVELADRLESVEVLDRRSGKRAVLGAPECGFGYRDSRFKSADRGRFLILEVTLRLSRRFQPRVHYASLAEELRRRGIDHPGPRQLIAAVMNLRRHRLPDPARLSNAGSFFKNPVVSRRRADALLAEHPDLPHWTLNGGRVKLAAAWMIERLGWKGRRFGHVGVYRHHALVLVNHGGATAAEVVALVRDIIGSVRSNFGVDLEPEPALIGNDRPASDTIG